MLPGFPETAAAAPPLSDSLSRSGISLRTARAEDLPFLRTLYAGFRALELAFAPWPAEQKQAFLYDQFRLQHLHFTRFFPAADFWLVEQRHPPTTPRPVGRLYLDRSAPMWRVVDIGFLPETRGKGLGSAMLEWIRAAAVTAGAEGVALQVAANNPLARALYLRVGFVDDGPHEGFHQPMVWRP